MDLLIRWEFPNQSRSASVETPWQLDCRELCPFAPSIKLRSGAVASHGQPRPQLACTTGLKFARSRRLDA